MCRGYVCILTTLCTLQLALAAAVFGMSIYAFAQAPVPDNTAPIVGLCVSCLALGTSIFGILGTVFGKRLMVISHGVCTLFVIVVAAVGLILSSLAAARVSYFQGLVIQIQRNLIENAVIPDTMSVTVKKNEPSSDERAGLFYDGFDVPDQYFYLDEFYYNQMFENFTVEPKSNDLEDPEPETIEIVILSPAQRQYTILAAIVFAFTFIIYALSGYCAFSYVRNFGELVVL